MTTANPTATTDAAFRRAVQEAVLADTTASRHETVTRAMTLVGRLLFRTVAFDVEVGVGPPVRVIGTPGHWQTDAGIHDGSDLKLQELITTLRAERIRRNQVARDEKEAAMQVQPIDTTLLTRLLAEAMLGEAEYERARDEACRLDSVYATYALNLPLPDGTEALLSRQGGKWYTDKCRNPVGTCTLVSDLRTRYRVTLNTVLVPAFQTALAGEWEKAEDAIRLIAKVAPCNLALSVKVGAHTIAISRKGGLWTGPVRSAALRLLILDTRKYLDLLDGPPPDEFDKLEPNGALSAFLKKAAEGKDFGQLECCVRALDYLFDKVGKGADKWSLVAGNLAFSLWPADTGWVVHQSDSVSGAPINGLASRDVVLLAQAWHKRAEEYAEKRESFSKRILGFSDRAIIEAVLGILTGAGTAALLKSVRPGSELKVSPDFRVVCNTAHPESRWDVYKGGDVYRNGMVFVGLDDATFAKALPKLFA